jgi:hypothetical protein
MMFRRSSNSVHALRTGEHPSQPSTLHEEQCHRINFGDNGTAAMPSSFAQREPTHDYLNWVERQEELDRLRNHARLRKSLLVFGPEGVGKSRLLQTFVSSQPLAVYIPQMRSPREFVLTLLQALHSADRRVKLPANLAVLSTSSLKGIVHRALDTQPFLMVLDHLDAPSRVVTGMIKDLHYYGRTPVIFASRSPHMEDIGVLRPLCAGRSERLELKNLPPQERSKCLSRMTGNCHVRFLEGRAPANGVRLLDPDCAQAAGPGSAVRQLSTRRTLPTTIYTYYCALS